MKRFKEKFILKKIYPNFVINLTFVFTLIRYSAKNTNYKKVLLLQYSTLMMIFFLFITEVFQAPAQHGRGYSAPKTAEKGK